jgi:hypothetical protein
MNPDPADFDALRRLLALKRHEQPPPGYFNRFSSQVIARIKAGERGEPASVLERLFGKANWWQRLWAGLESKPGFAGAFGAAVCALVISGIVYSENGPAPVAQSLMPAEPGVLYATAAATAANGPLGQPEFNYGGTNPVVPIADSLFGQFDSFQTQPANLVIPDGN